MIYVVIGAPCSGKTTYVREHAKQGDVIVDFDDIAVAFGSNVDHEHDHDIMKITLVVWMEAIREVVKHHYDHDVWIIDTMPTIYRQQLYAKANAKPIVLRVDSDELHQRATLLSRSTKYHDLIDRCVGNATSTVP